ncbi:MAG TPA: GNAT family N-acetyltransferase, partial [Rhodocyclaceae bacterium]|nr:GNAT family N-acetyltransferase [Rhodocyclaceae bacterium]
NSDGDSCEFALVVADAWQHQGVGRYLMQRLIEAARARGLRTMKGIFLASNDRMLHFVQRFGFIVHPDPKDHTLRQGILALLPD